MERKVTFEDHVYIKLYQQDRKVENKDGYSQEFVCPIDEVPAFMQEIGLPRSGRNVPHKRKKRARVSGKKRKWRKATKDNSKLPKSRQVKT